jgi:hypothetical protein
VYSLDKKPADQIRRGGDKWLQGMSEVHQNMVLGIEGAKAWRKGDDWRKYMRSWQGVGKADTRLKNLVKNGNILLPDIQIHKSIGAKAKNYNVFDPESGRDFKFVEGTRLQDVEVFAGKGARKPLREEVAEGLTEQFGGTADKWQHCKGFGTLDCDGEHIEAEVHWFQQENVGKIKFKVKEWFR